MAKESRMCVPLVCDACMGICAEKLYCLSDLTMFQITLIVSLTGYLEVHSYFAQICKILVHDHGLETTKREYYPMHTDTAKFKDI